MIPVFETKFASAYPGKPDNGVRLEYTTLADALTREHATDAHFAAYSVPTLPRRLSTAALGDVEISMVLYAADVDDPIAHAEHTPAGDEWRAAERAKVALLRAAHPGVFVYETRGGYRIIALPHEPIVLRTKADKQRWTARYLAFTRYLRDSFGMLADKACKDFTRLFRVPNGMRSGRRDVLPTYGDPSAIEAIEIPDPQMAGYSTAAARRALRRAVDYVRKTPVGERNETLNRKAYALGGMIAAGDLDEIEAKDALLDAIVANGGDAEKDMQKIAEAIDAGKLSPRSVAMSPSASPALRPLTDTGNAERLVDTHGDKIRFCISWSKWLSWDGARWEVDGLGRVHTLAKDVIRAMYGNAAEIADDVMRRNVADWARKSESADKRGSMVRLAQTEPGVAVLFADLDCDPWKLNVANGTIDLRTGRLLPHAPRDLITKLAPVTYDANAVAPRWDAFLRDVLPDAAVRDFMQRFVGYSLTGVTNERALAFLRGEGRNGKSLFLRVIRAMLGEYATIAAPELLMAKKGEAHPTEVADLFGARLAVCSEVKRGRAFDEEQLKRLTGDEPVKARRMKEDFWEFKPTAKIMMAANHRPRVDDETQSIWDRMCEVPFTVRIAEANVDKDLFEKLVAELPGVLAWAVEGCLQWQRTGLARPKAVQQATADYRSGEDALGRFLEDCCVIAPHEWVAMAALHEQLLRWAAQSAEAPVSKRALADRVKLAGGVEHRKNSARGWKGLRLMRPDETAQRDRGDKVTEGDVNSRLAMAHQPSLRGIPETTSPNVTLSPATVPPMAPANADESDPAEDDFIEFAI
jgi:P4 family phage/plasmid primase-like protien